MVNLGEEAIRAPFLLAAEEETDIMTMASTSVAISGLTITPSVPPDAVSGDWTYGGMGGVDVSPRLRRPRGHLSRVGVGLSLWPSLRLPRLLPFLCSWEGELGGVLVELVEVLVHLGGLQLINMHSVSHVASR
jgi:hypothetical protein